MQAIDTTSSVLGNINNILSAGYHGIIRYISPNTKNFPNKQLTPDEISAVHSVPGMALGLVYENGYPTSVGYFSAAQGTADATDALATFTSLGVPATIPVFFAVDYDAADADISGAILDYFTTVHAQFSAAGLLIGVYGSGATCSYLQGAGVVHYTWLSQSRGFNGYSDWKPSADIIQGPESTIAGLDSDTDYVVNEVVLW
jgi:hypothetical protein